MRLREIAVALVFLGLPGVASAQYVGAQRAMPRVEALDSLEIFRAALAVAADTSAMNSLADRFRADSTRLDSLASSIRDTMKVYLPAYLIKGPSVELFGDTARPDSLVISSVAGDGPGGGYVDYWNWTLSDSMTVPYAGATDLDLPSAEWPGKPAGATIYKAYPMFRIWHLRNPGAMSQFIDMGTFRARHPEGAWGVDDILSLSMNNGTSFLRFDGAGKVAASEIVGGLDISGILADTAHAVDLRFEDIKAYSSYAGNLTEMVVQTGLRVWFGDRPQSEIVWGWFPNHETQGTGTKAGVDSITVSIPHGASVSRCYLLANVYSVVSQTGADTVFTADSNVGIAASGGAYTAGLKIPWTRFPGLYPIPRAYGRGLGPFTGAVDISAVVDGSGTYAVNAGPISSAGSLAWIGWQGGLLLTYTY